MNLEILAPAGGAGALTAAVLCGADAVYLGVDAFNARRNAENFTTANLPEIVSGCHIRGVKVYLTLNILLLESEIPDFLRLAHAACNAGVDAVIVQDLGAARLLRNACPGLRMHASTQMAVHNPEGAARLAELGFARVVLARECSKDEIAAIVASTPLEVEVFVHGALCMSVSGQCYLSAVLGQRSGNRGLCAQPCRLPFSAPGRECALSLKDTSLIPRLHELREIGVHSLKIEGRMKRPEYVAAAVSACRAARAGEAVDLDSLQAVFSRSGFTEEYFTGTRSAEMFGVRGKEDVTAAAGVLGQLENLYTDPRKQVQRVDVTLDFAMQPDCPATLAAQDTDGNVVRATGEIPQTAMHKPTDPERAQASLEKTGGTPFRVTETRCAIAPGLMLPVSALNALRRDVFAQLSTVRGQIKPIPFVFKREPPVTARAVPAKPALRVRLERAAQLSEPIRNDARLIILPPDQLEELLAAGAADCLDRLCVGVPRMLFDGRAAARARLERLREAGITHASVGNLGAVTLARELGFTAHGEAFLNAVNIESVKSCEELGLCDLTLSFEETLAAAQRLQSPIPIGLAVYGHLPLMTVRNCPLRHAVGCARCKDGANRLTDRKGAKLRVNCAYGCSEISNPQPLYMGDRLDELRGLDFALLHFTEESPAACARIFAEYQSGGEPPQSYTRGLLYKTIL